MSDDPMPPPPSPRLPIRAPQRSASLGDPINTGYQITLMHRDGAYYSPLLRGSQPDYYYPRLSTTPVALAFETGSPDAPINSGDVVTIVTIESYLSGRDVLGKFIASWCYYWEAGWEKERFTIHRSAGPGAVCYGDEIYFVNESNGERLGRSEGLIYLGTDGAFTDTFVIGAPWEPPLISSALPLDQLGWGTQHYAPAHGYVWSKTTPGQQITYFDTRVPAGDYTILVQLAPGGSVGKPCAEIWLTVDNYLISQTTIYTEDYPADDWQRATVPLTTGGGRLTIGVMAADNSESLWTGAISVNPAGQRPFWAIAHRCNTVDNLLDAVKAGANAIEFDITAKLDGSDIVYWVHHGGQPTWVLLEDYLKAVIDNNVLQTVAMLQFDIKGNDDISAYTYGYDVAAMTKEHGIQANQTFFSVEDAGAANDFYNGVAAAGMAGSRDVSLIKTDPSVYTDPSIWYRTGIANGATFLGLGVFAKNIFSTMANWIEPVSYTANMRDRVQTLKKTYFWTLDSQDSMRKMLDLGVDGLIVNDPAKLLAVLAEKPYDKLYRLATSDDSQLTVFGWP